jgi:hypothetical protein
MVVPLVAGASDERAMSELWSAGELVGWLASPALCWVRCSGLAVVLARRGEELLGAQRLASGDERAVGEALLARWEQALVTVALRDVAELAAAFSSWTTGEPPVGQEVVVDRAVDLTLRAGAVARDARRLALLRSKPAETLRQAHERSARLARPMARAPTSERGLLALELEDVAARGAGEALIAVLLAGETA